MRWQRDAVAKVLDGSDTPLHGALSFVGADWKLLFAKALTLDGVRVTWPAKLAELIVAPGPLDADGIEQVARLLPERLPALRS
ncbi:MAG: hypothetical protein U5R31_14890 [Acidimicrobiia bacterium]|nr:hypothetical protein [Acidimicrobiia bacterium]